MIQEMSKYAFLVFHQEYDAFLLRLRELGVLHIQERRDTREVEALQIIQRQRSELKPLLRKLRPYLEGQELPLVAKLKERNAGAELAQELEAMFALLEQQRVQLASLRNEADEVAHWGDFDPVAIERLKDAGYQLNFYAAPLARYSAELAKRSDLVEITVLAGKQYFVQLQRVAASDEEVSLDAAERINPPARSIGQLQRLIASQEEEIKSLENSLVIEAPSLQIELEAYDRLLENELSFGQAQLQAERLAQEKVCLLEGFVPSIQAKPFELALADGGYYFKQVDFDPETERVPIQLQNNAFVRCFEFITGLFSLPNYQEIDQTALIAPFFMLFFGMCFGDAGYGLILLAVTSYYRLKSKDGDTSLLALGQWLGGGAFVIGIGLGAIFGMELPWAHNKDYLFNQDNMMTIAVIIGIIQVLLGKVVGAYKKGRQLGWRHSLSGYAWVLLLIALGLIYALPMLQIALPSVLQYILYGIAGVSVLCAFLYNTPGRNPLLNIGSGLWTSYETASGLLGDSLSYIRLFAIGLTGGILGSVFNQLAMSCVPSGEGASIVAQIVGWILALIILALGHGINFGIAIIGSFVHPLRLTFVEYYKNSEFEGGGKPYTPLKRK